MSEETQEEVTEIIEEVKETTQETSEIEEKAKKMGWTPKDEFRGDPDKWREAAEFVERGENMLPILRKAQERSERKVQQLEATVRQLTEDRSRAEQRAYDRAVKELKTRRIEAIAAGNTQEFVQIDDEIAELTKEVKANNQQHHQEPLNPTFEAWQDKNPWITTDKKMKSFAENIGQFLHDTEPDLAYEELLEEVERQVKAKFPDKFSNPRRAAPQAVSGATSSIQRRGKTYNDMPKEFREACDQFSSMYGVSKETYVKNYFSGEQK